MSPHPALQVVSKACPKLASHLLECRKSLPLVYLLPSRSDLPHSISPLLRKTGRSVLPVVEDTRLDVVQHADCSHRTPFLEHVSKRAHLVTLGRLRSVCVPVL